MFFTLSELLSIPAYRVTGRLAKTVFFMSISADMEVSNGFLSSMLPEITVISSITGVEPSDAL